MKLTSLINALVKIPGASMYTFSYTEVNKAICFTLNNKRYQADYTKGKEKIESFCTVTGYDERNQEHERRFFTTFKQVLTHSERK